MDRRSSFSFSLLCCLALMVAGCSGFMQFGKASKYAQSDKASKAQAEALKPDTGGEDGRVLPDGKERTWDRYATDRNGIDYFVEKASLTYPSKTMILAWRKRTFPLTSQQKEIISFDEIDCASAQYRSFHLQAIYWDGTTKTFKKTGPWVHIFADTPDEQLYLDECRQAKDAGR